MANMLENFGLDFFAEEEESLMGLVGYATKEGKAITGYGDTPYLFKSMGDAELWVKTGKKVDGNLYVSGFDTHCANACVWNLVHFGIDLTPKNASNMERIAIFQSEKARGGMIPVEIINADVLPSWMKGDKIEAQMVALPIEINYYADEDEYAENQPSDKDGKKWLMATGSMAALSFLCNHSPDVYEQGKNYESDRYVQFAAVVKSLYHGKVEINGEEHNLFIRCLADTDYGELEFCHTLDQVPEELRDNIKVGAIISGSCILSGDVAINAYDKGILRNFEHNLKLFRYTLESGDPERLRSVLANDVAYETDTSGKTYLGADEIVKRFNYIHDNRDSEYTTYYATIIETDDDDMEYPIGTRCIILANGEGEENYESIGFINVNDDGMISRIKISTDSRYHFSIDQPERIKTPLDDVKIPESVVEPIILRAKYHSVIDTDIEDEAIIENIDDYRSLEQNAERMLDAIAEDPQPDIEVALENVMGYLFAKAIEQTVNERTQDFNHGSRLVASFSPGEAFEGKLTSTLSPEKHAVLERAMELGKQFYKDLKMFMIMNESGEDQFVELFKQAAVVIQRLGQLYSERCFEDPEDL